MSTLVDQLTSTLDRFTEAWKTNDGQAVANCFSDDGSLINPFGQHAEGRSAVAAMYAEYFGGMLRDSSTTLKLTHARVIENQHAFVDGDQTIYGPDGSVVLVAHIAALFRRDGDDWLWVDSRPYTFPTILG